jgi:hypothetical protein
MNHIGSLWRDLAGEKFHHKHGWYSRRLYPDAVSNIRAAILEPEGTPALLIEVPAAVVPSDFEFPGSRGFDLFAETLVPGPSGQVRLCLLLSDRIYWEVFEVLCQDVAETIAKASSETITVQTLLSRLRVWQAFMLRFGTRGLGQEEQIGLFAELNFLRDNVIDNLPDLSALQCWEGPKGGVQDFNFPECAIEVKGTTAFPCENIKISSLLQLDETRIKKLILCHMAFDTNNIAGITLPEIVHDIRNCLSLKNSSNVSKFNDLLLEAGYLDSHESLYSGRRYLIREYRYFEVIDSFPRIRFAEVRRGVIEGSYNIQLRACLPFEIAPERVQNLIREK